MPLIIIIIIIIISAGRSGGFKLKASSATDQEGSTSMLVPTSTGLLHKPVGVSGEGLKRTYCNKLCFN